MKTTTKNCFSNGTEWMIWTSNNCDQCHKQSKYKLDEDEYTKFVCKIDMEINGQMAGLQEISERTYNITQQADCPYRQAVRPKTVRRHKTSTNKSQISLL